LVALYSKIVLGSSWLFDLIITIIWKSGLEIMERTGYFCWSLVHYKTPEDVKKTSKKALKNN